MSVYAIRLMQSTDAAPIARWTAEIPLWQRYGIQAEALAAQLEAAIAGGSDLLYSLVLADDPVARGFVWCLRRGAFGRSPYIRLIGVHPYFASRGFGGVLLEHIEAICSDFNNLLFLLVSDFNLDAQRFYQRHGYQQIGEIPAFVLPDVSELIYCKRLQ
jgi:ribosomal protein S18 acetylase RimI-like enzyme